MPRLSQARGLISLAAGEYRKSWLRNAAIVCILAFCCTVVSLYDSILVTTQVRTGRRIEPLTMTVDLMVVANKGKPPALKAKPTITRYLRRPVEHIEEALRLPVISRLGRLNVLGVLPHSVLVGWEGILATGAPITGNGQMVVSTALASAKDLSIGDHLSLSLVNESIGIQESADFEIVGLTTGEPFLTPIMVSRDDLTRIGFVTEMNVALIRRSAGSDQGTLLQWAKETYGNCLYLSAETPSEIGLGVLQDQQSPASMVLILAYLFLVICTLTFAYMGYLGRTKEMAILRAVGGSGPQILGLFAMQSLTNAVLGWGIGRVLIQITSAYFERRGLIDGAVATDGTAFRMAALVVLTGSCVPTLLAKSATISELLQSRKVPIWRERVAQVESHDFMAVEREQRDGVRLLRLLTTDGLFEGVLLRHPGETVKAGEVLAVLDSFFGLRRKEWAAPVDGEIRSYDGYSGLLVIEPARPALAQQQVLVSGLVEPHPPLVQTSQPTEVQPDEPNGSVGRFTRRLGGWRASPGTIVTAVIMVIVIAYWRSQIPYASAVTIRKGEFKDLIALSGSVRTAEQSEVVSLVPGTIVQALVKEGQRVTAGDPLYRLASTNVIASVKQAQLELAVAQASYLQLVRESSTGDIKRAAELQVLRDRISYAALRQAEADLRVYAPNDGTVIDLQVSVGDEVGASAPLLTIQGPSEGRNDRPKTVSSLQTQAELAARERDAAKLRLYAPYDGVVSTISTSVGQSVAPGDRLLTLHSPEALAAASPDRELAIGLARISAALRVADLAGLELRAPSTGQLSGFHLMAGVFVDGCQTVGQIADTRRMRALAQVSEGSVMEIAPGAEATVTVLATGKTYLGEVVRRADLPQAGSLQYAVEIELENDGRLMVGMTAQVKVRERDGSWANLDQGRLEAGVASLVHADVAGEVQQVCVENGAWVQAGELLAKLSNESIVIAHEQACLSLKQLETSVLSTELAGEVVAIAIQPGAMVKQGDLLAVLTNKEVEAALAQSRLAVERLQSAIVRVRTTGTVAQLHVAKGEQVRAGTLLLELHNDEVVQRAKRAAHTLAVSEASLAALTDEPGEGSVELGSIKVEIAKTKYAAALADEDALTIRAPISGTVKPRSEIRVGEVIHQGTVLANIVDATSLQMDLVVDEMDLPYIRPGQAVTVVMNAIPGVSYSGQVVRVAEEGQQRNSVTSFPATIIIGEAQPDPLAEAGEEPIPIKIGMMGSAVIEVLSRQDAIIIPREYLTWVDGNPYVTMLVSDRQVQSAVKVGAINQTQAEITGGLIVGDVVVSGVRVPPFITRLLTVRWDDGWKTADVRGW